MEKLSLIEKLSLNFSTVSMHLPEIVIYSCGLISQSLEIEVISSFRCSNIMFSMG